MLAVSPTARPDLETILRLPFIKKHVSRFFGDIAARAAGDVGDGTLVLAKVGESLGGAATDSPSTGGGESSREIEALIQQLEGLDMAGVIAAAVRPGGGGGGAGAPPSVRPGQLPRPVRDVLQPAPPPSNVSSFQVAAAPVVVPLPTDERAARQQEREQSAALHREEERRTNVEAALQRLRQERAERQRSRSAARSVLAFAWSARNARTADTSTRGVCVLFG